MGKNSKGGSGYKKKAKKHLTDTTRSRELIKKDESQNYAYVEKMLGYGNTRIIDNEGNNILGIIRKGTKRRLKSNRIAEGDLILISVREYQTDKADIIHKYTSSEINKLHNSGEISQTLYKLWNSNLNIVGEDNGEGELIHGIQFDYDNVNEEQKEKKEDNIEIDSSENWLNDDEIDNL